ncbi:hypothetical protein GOP47_0029077 [Adiantum capillus-veneris]|nr:hypothetical protein GOP47_0029077 [Adiantum capillus-veneris]
MDNCPSFSSFFHLHCKEGGELYLTNMTYNDAIMDMRVVHLDAHSLIVDVTRLGSSPMVSSPNGNGSCLSTTEPSSLALPAFPSPFIISDDNLFGSFGCSMGILIGVEFLHNASTSEHNLRSVEVGGCFVICPGDNMNPECGGRTCCVSRLGRGTSFRGVIYYVSPSAFIMNTSFDASIECGTMHTTLFHPNYSDFSRETYGMNLTWALPSNQTQSISDLKQTPDFACSSHSHINIVQEVPGYYCSCLHGFDGDGYSQGVGCSDIDECLDPFLNDCIPGKSTCHNLEGGYNCKCNSKNHVGDGLRSGNGCSLSPTLRNALAIVGAIIFVGLLIGGLAIFAIWWRRRTKRKYFMQNGGVQLQDMIVKAGGKWESRLFTAEELKEATENYADHMKLGMGGFGTVYKGVLLDGQLVAIKKANRAEGGNEQFLNELQILIHINHRNIVRLLGCCMETAMPLLVYEYVSHGNVRENLEEGGSGVMGWKQRLKVARQIADALAYLHAAAFPPILHRDVKSANVLLDNNLDAKVADFGVSRLVPDGLQHVSTAVQGTIGYLDPEYFQTLQLTDKSDVYSLGVMLVELISGLKPVDSRTREPRFTNLALLFIHYMQEARGEDLIDPRLVEPSTLPSNKSWDVMRVRSSIMAVADLAHRCLALRGADRPSMSLLADELRHIARALEDSHHDKDVDNEAPLMPLRSKLYKHGEAGAVVSQNAEFFVQSTSGISLNSLNAPTMPR